MIFPSDERKLVYICFLFFRFIMSSHCFYIFVFWIRLPYKDLIFFLSLIGFCLLFALFYIFCSILFTDWPLLWRDAWYQLQRIHIWCTIFFSANNTCLCMLLECSECNVSQKPFNARKLYQVSAVCANNIITIIVMKTTMSFCIHFHWILDSCACEPCACASEYIRICVAFACLLLYRRIDTLTHSIQYSVIYYLQ